MPRLQIHELQEFSANRHLQEAANKYKNYCTIRRDLRTVDAICTYIIKLQYLVISDNTKLEEVKNEAVLIRASAMYAILLYSRWFKATKGKPMLKPDEFFDSNSKELLLHKEIVRHRDSYLAHNELDLLGSDRVWVNTDESGQFISSESDFLEEMWLQDKELNMSTFQKCVHIVHNKIDAEIIPERQTKLDEQLKKLLDSGSCRVARAIT